MAKNFEPSLINSILTGFVEDLLANKGNLAVFKPTEIAGKPVNEYEGRMLIKGSDKFDVAVYIAAASIYLNKGDLQGHRARGALVLYMDIEVADKIFKAAGLQVPYDEDDESMLGLCGSLCQLIANALKERLSADGYVELEFSSPEVYKNTISEGVEFCKDQNEKQEISFYFLKHKALVIDWTLAPIPKK
jgi:hypothetical protein